MSQSTLKILEAQLEEATSQLQSALEDGAEAVTRYEAKLEDKDRQITDLVNQLAKCPKPAPLTECEHCDDLRLWLALAETSFLIAIWYHLILPSDEIHRTQRGWLLAFCYLPFAFHIQFRLWRHFKRKYRWNAWNDNTPYRVALNWWNSLIEQFKVGG